MKSRYRELCRQEPSIPLFSMDWWLDAVVGDNWDVILVEKGQEVQAAMPLAVKRRYGLRLLTQPPLTQTLGPWIRPTDAKYANRLGREKELMQALIDQLPSYHYFAQNWHFTQTNWLPFFWNGFQQTTIYTYRLNQLAHEEQIWSGLQENIRREIKKALNRENIKVRMDLGIDDFFELNRQVFERQGKQVPYSKAFVQNLDKAAAQHNARQIFIAEDAQGRRHAGIYLVWDQNSAYYLMGGGDPELRKSGATSLCMWEAIRFAATVSKSFDFEGSMLEPVERFFRAFGAMQTPYYSVSHAPFWPVRIATLMCSLRK